MKRMTQATYAALSKDKSAYTAKSMPSASGASAASTGKRSKYNNARTTYKGMRFDSKAELRRWQELEQLLEVGAIKRLRHHPKCRLALNGVKICTYEGDAEYWMVPDDLYVLEDTKGVRTAVYQIKKKLIKALCDVDIQEIKA